MSKDLFESRLANKNWKCKLISTSSARILLSMKCFQSRLLALLDPHRKKGAGGRVGGVKLSLPPFFKGFYRHLNAFACNLFAKLPSVFLFFNFWIFFLYIIFFIYKYNFWGVGEKIGKFMRRFTSSYIELFKTKTKHFPHWVIKHFVIKSEFWNKQNLSILKLTNFFF